LVWQLPIIEHRAGKHRACLWEWMSIGQAIDDDDDDDEHVA